MLWWQRYLDPRSSKWWPNFFSKYVCPSYVAWMEFWKVSTSQAAAVAVEPGKKTTKSLVTQGDVTNKASVMPQSSPAALKPEKNSRFDPFLACQRAKNVAMGLNKKFLNTHQTSNGSWCIGIKGEMSGTVCVTFTWDIYIYMSCL